MEFMRKEYSIRYAPNTRETVRRQVLHQLVLAVVTDLNPFDSRASFKFKIARVLQIGEQPGLTWTPSEALLRLHA
jgi:BsuBI/PstI restriction endonuclease HTH domain